MRPGQNKRMRGRPNNNGGGGGNRKGPNPLTRSYESNGPDVKIRGNAHHVAEKYLQLARDAQSSGDPVAAESYLQHAEHYFRLIASAQAAQAGYTRQPDAVDTEGEDEDDSGIPDRFASPQAQAPAPFVPQAQPYGAERQPYNGESRQPYSGQANGAERQAYGDRQTNGERPQYADRNTYQQRQDRNGLNRRPYRDNGATGEIRTDDRTGERQERPGQERPSQERPYQQDRSYQDRNGQNRRERFAQDRNGQERTQDRGQGDRYRDQQSEQPPRDPSMGEQPAVDAVVEQRPEAVYQPAAGPMAAPEAAPQSEATVQAVARAEPVRRRERVERTAAPVTDETPGLPSFITTPTRVAASEAAAVSSEPSLTTATPFPGDDAEEAPKFPRRRRRTTRATAEPGQGGEQPAPTDD